MTIQTQPVQMSREGQARLTLNYLLDYTTTHEAELRERYSDKYLALSLDEGVIDSDVNLKELAGRISKMDGRMLYLNSKPGKLVLIRHINTLLSDARIKI